MTDTATMTDIPAYCLQLAQRARAASQRLATSSGEQRSAALRAVADQIRAQSDTIIEANAKDLEAGREMDLSDAMIDRLELDAARVEKIAASVDKIADQP
ncbi:MAG: gamma-glutamyl-phosphate reductase, partial [Phycisphaeraceae bacterium]|nr:gamma-glutamyl-phosphate reductase [Phycisphaeraceae bacterium]